MASVGVAPTSGLREPSGHTVGVDRLPEEMNDMKIRDDKVRIALIWNSLSSFHRSSSFADAYLIFAFYLLFTHMIH